jgi:hypothetical protein
LEQGHRPVHCLDPQRPSRPHRSAMRGGAAAADDGAVRPLYDQGGIVVAVIVPGRHLQLRKELRE